MVTVATTSLGQRIITIALHHVGCSLQSRRDELASLVAGPADEPEAVVQIKTNCAMFVRGVLRRAGVVHEILEKPYRSQMAVSDVLTIGNYYGAAHKFHYQPLIPGTILHYATAGKNDDHVEILVDPVSSPHWSVRHVGGGRPNNAVTLERGDIRVSWGRPLVTVIDPRGLEEFK